MLKNLKMLMLILFFFSSLQSRAYIPKEGTVNAGMGFLISQTHVKNSDYKRTNPSFGGFALIAEGDLNPSGSLEINLMYFQKSYARQNLGKFISEKTEVVNANLGYRCWMHENISLAIGLSSIYSLGEKQILYSDFTTNETIDTSASSIVKYGADISLQFEVWRKDDYSIFFDNRYNYALSNKEDEIGDHLLHMIGFKTLMQSK